MCWNVLKVLFKKEIETYEDSAVSQTTEEM